MSLIEFIGFVISFVAMVVLFFKRTIETRRRTQNPELYEAMEQRKEASMREFLRALDVQHNDEYEEDDEEDEEDDEPQPVKAAVQRRAEVAPALGLQRPHRSVDDQFRFRTKIDQYQPQTAIEKRGFLSKIDERFKERPIADRVVSDDMETDPHADAYALDRKVAASRVESIIHRLGSSKEMIVIQEVLGPPKALRPWQ